MIEQQEHTYPARIGKYEVLGILGRGGMGVVYRARDSRIGRDVAIKTLTDGFSGNADMLKRFYQEAGRTGNLRHPNIVIIYDFGDENGLPFIVMEYLDGDPLDKVIRDKDSVHLSVKLGIIEQICSALAYAHSQGMIHRDVKPANIIVQSDGLVKLLDFGIARADEDKIDGGMTRTGTLVGTPAYMAPERLQGNPIDGRSDIFALGVVLYQLLTSKLPFDAEYPAILHQILEQEPAPLSSVLSDYPAQLDQVVERALAKKPMDRYASAGDMGADLNAIGARLKAERVSELFEEAEAAVQKADYTEAKQLIRLILRIDARHAGAKKLSATVNEALRLMEARRRIDQLLRVAEESIEAKDWEHALTICGEALALEPESVQLLALKAKAEAGKARREQVRKLLREVELARAAGDFDSAKKSARAASELEPTDSKILAICTVLTREAEEQQRKVQVRALLSAARDQLSCRALEAAAKTIAEAEELEPTSAETLHLKDEIAAALEQQRRKHLVDALSEKALVAVTYEQIQAVSADVVKALESFPAEPTLLRLKIQLEPRLKEQEVKRKVAEVSEACRHLGPADALACVREALRVLSGNQDLLDLEFAISQKLARQEREQTLADHLGKARTLLEDHLYLETVKALEQAEREGFSSSEMTELLEMARKAASERVSQDLVERSFLEAKRLFSEQNFEEVMRLLPPVLERVDEPSLRRQLEEASRNQAKLEERVAQVASEANILCELELFDAVIGLISSETPGVRRAKSVQALLQLCTEKLASEEMRFSGIGSVYAQFNKPECPEAFRQLNSTPKQKGQIVKTDEIEKRLSARIQTMADEQLTRSVESAKLSLGNDDATTAESHLKACGAWSSFASPAMQADFQAAQTEVVAAHKVLRFRKVLKRRA